MGRLIGIGILREEMVIGACREETKRIWDLSQKKDVFLVCYEKYGENCHIHILDRFDEELLRKEA